MLAANRSRTRCSLRVFPSLDDSAHGGPPIRIGNAFCQRKSRVFERVQRRLLWKLAQWQKSQIEESARRCNQSLPHGVPIFPVMGSIHQQPTAGTSQMGCQSLDFGILLHRARRIGVHHQAAFVGNLQEWSGRVSLASIDDNPLSTRCELKLFGSPLLRVSGRLLRIRSANPLRLAVHRARGARRAVHRAARIGRSRTNGGESTGSRSPRFA